MNNNVKIFGIIGIVVLIRFFHYFLFFSPMAQCVNMVKKMNGNKLTNNELKLWCMKSGYGINRG